MARGLVAQAERRGMPQEWALHPNMIGTRRFLCPECAWRFGVPWRPVQTPENALVLGHVFNCGECGGILPFSQSTRVGRA